MSKLSYIIKAIFRRNKKRVQNGEIYIWSFHGCFAKFRPPSDQNIVSIKIRVNIGTGIDEYPREATPLETQIKDPGTQPHALISLYPQIRANHNAEIWSPDNFNSERIKNNRSRRSFPIARHQKRMELSVFVSHENEMKAQNTEIHWEGTMNEKATLS